MLAVHPERIGTLTAGSVADGGSEHAFACHPHEVIDDDERRRKRRSAMWFPVLCVGAPMIAMGAYVALVAWACAQPPSVGPLQERLPEGVSMAAQAAWCAEPWPKPQPEVSEPWWRSSSGRDCHQLIVVERPGTSADTLAAELRNAFAGFGTNNVDNGFDIRPESARVSERAASARVVIEQSHSC